MRRRYKIGHRLAEIYFVVAIRASGDNINFSLFWHPFGSIIFRYGVCYSSTNTIPDFSDSVVNFNTKVPYSITNEGFIFSASRATTYYIRAFVENVNGISWSDVLVEPGDNPATIPTISTIEPFSVYSGSAKSGGIIANDGGGAITAKGVCWNTTGTPTTDDSTSSEGTGTADFESNMTPLNPSTTYYVRAYATNSAGTAYGDEETFTTTAATIPTVLLYNATDIDTDQIRLWGRIVDNGGSVITSKGFVWNLTGNPTQTSNFNSGGSGDADFNVLITGLPSGVVIYMRVVAQNSTGWALGQVAEVTLMTEGYPPTVTMGSITNITPSKATASGNVTDDGSSTVSERGFVVSLTSVNSNPLIGGTGVTKFIVSGTTGPYSGDITGLTCGSGYSIKSYAMNVNGIGYGDVSTFTVTSLSYPSFYFTEEIHNSCYAATIVDYLSARAAANIMYNHNGSLCGGLFTSGNDYRVESMAVGSQLYNNTIACTLMTFSGYRIYYTASVGGDIYILQITDGIIVSKDLYIP